MVTYETMSVHSESIAFRYAAHLALWHSLGPQHTHVSKCLENKLPAMEGKKNAGLEEGGCGVSYHI